ncbi:MAG TPA: response regulator [Bryobacteraceae bacterium]|jgi:DNA-binding NtrC family response regulator|nr:response regulator [Bryobacteraceae bacterium]
MRKKPGIAGGSTGTSNVRPASADRIAVLSVSPCEEDHLSLEGIIGHSNWILLKATSLPSALASLRRRKVGVVLCERDLPGTWVGLLEYINTLPVPQPLILTSRLADDRLWAEALNLGAWDVLAKPFDRGEVFRSVKSAWQHWHDRTERPTPAMKVMMTAAS